MKTAYLEGLAFIVSGISLFFIGMNFFTGGMGNLIKKKQIILKKIDKFGIIGYYASGILTTTVIQSSDATTILSMDLAENNVLDKSKALALSFGARLGTTITPLLTTLNEIGVSSFIIGLSLPIALFFPKKHPNAKNALLGFGLFFAGLYLLKQGTLEAEELFYPLFSKTGNNALLFFIGLLFTAVIQSSSATSSILVILTSAGLMDLSCSFFIYLGATVGTTATPILASIKSGKNAKYIAGVYAFSALFTGVFGLTVCNYTVDKITALIEKIPQSFRLAVFGIIYSFASSAVSLFLQKPLEFSLQKLSLSKKSKKNQPSKRYRKSG